MSLPNPDSEKTEPVMTTTIPPVSPVVATAPSLSTPTPNNNKVLVPFLIGVAVLILGIGGYAAWIYFNPAPEKVMSRMLEAVLTVNSVSYKAEVISDAAEENSLLSDFAPTDLGSFSPETIEKIDLNLSGVVDLVGGENETTNFSLNFSLKDANKKTEVFSGDYLSLDEEKYLKLNSVDTSNEDLAPFMTALGDSWLNLGDSGFDNFDENGDLVAPTEETQPTISSENQDKLDKLFVETDFLQVTEKLKNEKVDDVDCFHYAVQLDKEALVSYVATRKLYSDTTFLSEAALEVLAKTEIISGELWVGRKDYLPRHLVLNISFEETETQKISTASFDLLLNEFNQPAKLAVPEKVMSYTDFFSAMIDAMINSEDFGFDAISESIGVVSEEDLDGDGLTNIAEADFGSDPNLSDTDSDGLDDLNEWFFDTDPNNSDTDSDGVIDGVEYEAGTDPTDPESK